MKRLPVSLAFRAAGWAACSLVMFAIGPATFPAASSAASKTANPNDKDSTLPLAIHGEQPSDKLQDDAQARYAQSAKALFAALAKEKNGQLNKLDAKSIGESHAALQQMRRMALQLQTLGEPAGVDFQFRHDAMIGHVVRIAQSYSGTTEGGVFVTKIRQFITRTAPERANTLKRLGELVRQEKWTEADALLFQTLDKLATMTVFLSPDEQRPIYDPFAEARQIIETAMRQINAAKADEILRGRLESLHPNPAGLIAQVNAAADQLASSPTIMLDGQAFSGPQAMSQFLERWQALHGQVHRYYGTLLAMQSIRLGAFGAMAPVGGPVPGRVEDPTIAQYQDTFADTMCGSLAKLVAADTARVAAADVPALHAAYLQAAALPANRVVQDKLAAALNPALNQLAAKSPAYAARVAAYAEATNELLRWRQRTAENMARMREPQYPSVEKPFHQATISTQTYAGLFDQSTPQYGLPRFLAAAPDILPPAVEKLKGAKVTFTGARALANGKAAMTVMQWRVYGTTPSVRAKVDEQVQLLKRDLFVTDQAGPLSLAAATALATAEAGDWESVGGALSGMHLEAYVTRLATLPDAASLLSPLGTLPATPVQDNSFSPTLSQAAVRFEVTAEWVQHRYFFAEVPAE